MPRSAYHFVWWCRPAAEQAAWFIRNVPRDASALPPVIDAEWAHGPTAAGASAARTARQDPHHLGHADPPLRPGADPLHRHQLPQGRARRRPSEEPPFWLRSTAPSRTCATPRAAGRSGSSPRRPRARHQGHVDRNAFYGTDREFETFMASGCDPRDHGRYDHCTGGRACREPRRVADRWFGSEPGRPTAAARPGRGRRAGPAAPCRRRPTRPPSPRSRRWPAPVPAPARRHTTIPVGGKMTGRRGRPRRADRPCCRPARRRWPRSRTNDGRGRATLTRHAAGERDDDSEQAGDASGQGFSWGELFDKITILRIKVRRPRPPTRFRNAAMNSHPGGEPPPPPVRSTEPCHGHRGSLRRQRDAVGRGGRDPRLRARQGFRPRFVELAARSITRTTSGRAEAQDQRTALSPRSSRKKSYAAY